ncbi:MAG: transcription elongation factor GreA [Candidatus Daviesbacteria bacterium]|nr:MAG: transcription elongation factor GreA [Candidatus Daviesbacteria bacterium]
MIRQKKNYFTSKGLQEAESELDYLRKIKRKEVTERIQRAREFGDLSENSEYDSALEEHNLTESRIAELEGLLKNVQIIKEEKTNSDFVVIGSTVAIELDGQVDEFTIVGKMEADPSKKKISNESPMGGALLGAKVGETIEVATPIVRYRCKVLEIK